MISRFELRFRIVGPDLDVLRDLGEQVRGVLAENPLFFGLV